MPVGSVTIGGGGSAWMEDIVVVAGRICTRAFLVFSDRLRETKLVRSVMLSLLLVAGTTVWPA